MESQSSSMSLDMSLLWPRLEPRPDCCCRSARASPRWLRLRRGHNTTHCAALGSGGAGERWAGVQDLGGECDGQRQPGLGRRGNKDQMIAVRLQFAQSSVREAARRTGQSGEFYSPPRVAELAGSQEPAAKSVRVTAAGESRDGRHAAERTGRGSRHSLYLHRGKHSADSASGRGN